MTRQEFAAIVITAGGDPAWFTVGHPTVYEWPCWAEMPKHPHNIHPYFHYTQDYVMVHHSDRELPEQLFHHQFTVEYAAPLIRKTYAAYLAHVLKGK